MSEHIDTVLIDQGIGGFIALSESDMVFLALSSVYCKRVCSIRVMRDVTDNKKFCRENTTVIKWFNFPYYGETIFINGDEYIYTITGQYVRVAITYADL